MKKDNLELSGFFDQGVNFSGELKFTNSLRIDGKFQGKIISTDELIVGEKGVVEAEIEVGRISISGTVKGTIKASERVELLPTSKVEANIITKNLIINEGAIFNGSCSMDEKAGAGKIVGAPLK
jgi:cytoskeletal protein CcmA (bactofilin family)